MQHPRRLGPLRPEALLLAGAALLPAGAGRADDLADDGAPTSMVSFFLAAGPSCPEGWVPAAEARGRLVVAVTTPVQVGVQVGQPLSDQEDRRHGHAYSAQGALPYKAVAAADGGNRSGAKAGALSLEGQLAPAASGLPFIQLLACEKR